MIWYLSKSQILIYAFHIGVELERNDDESFLGLRADGWPLMGPRPLLSWLEDPATGRGIRFAAADDAWESWSYADLASLSLRVAAGLAEMAVPRGSVVSIVQQSSPRFVATLFGAMVAGCVPSPVAPPLTFQDPEAYAAHVRGLLGSAAPHLVVADEDLVETLQPIARTSGVAPRLVGVEGLLAAGPDEPRARAPRAELALLQFTSGSSGAARGIRVPYGSLEANIDAIRGWLRMTPDDPTASWLPVHHDMGLIGCLLTPVVNQSDIWLMKPEQFIHTPLRYLQCFGTHGARLTAMPNFGLSYIARRVKPAQVEGLDFSHLRTVIVGAERLDPVAFEGFHGLLGPRGLTRLAVLPAYGLAESTLAVTGLALEEEWTSLSVEPGSLALGRKVALAAPGEDAQQLIGCGRPLGGAHVAIHDPDGGELPEGAVGEIVVTGPSVAAGYVTRDAPAAPVGEGAGAPSSFAGGALHTGDAGFLMDGQLYVLGRLGDSMKVRGRAIFAEDLEAALGVAGVPPLRVAALLGVRDGTPTAVALFEQAAPEWLETCRTLLAQRTEGARVVVVNAPRGSIARTSSGKPKRRLLWRRFLDDMLPGDVVVDSGDQTNTLRGLS
ncbi:MAG: AMP-dependent synthetase and ligase [Nonomuraea muscovyensis]|nr:AMP-dependent synthetase and ligase [Nonomuraea muscovyensis]